MRAGVVLPKRVDDFLISFIVTSRVRRRSLVLHGPLRSMALMPGPVSAVRWSRLVVDVQPQARPSLAASALVAELQGDLYEMD